MSIYHLAVLALFLIPLAAWAYRSSTAHAAEPPGDLPTSAFAIRAIAVLLGFTALYLITSQNLVQALMQAVIWMMVAVAIFAIAWHSLRVFRRRFSTPRRRLFELWLFLLALSIVMVLIEVQMDKIQNG